LGINCTDLTNKKKRPKIAKILATGDERRIRQLALFLLKKHLKIQKGGLESGAVREQRKKEPTAAGQ